MTFPETPRVIYEENPLVEVICQLKFPPILRIDTELPAVFQELIRKEYPVVQMAEQVSFPQPLMKLLQQSVPASFFQGRTYQFISEDSKWTISVSREFLALSTSQYKRWEEFRGKLQTAMDAFVSTYTPSFFTRVGLRYRDVINKSSEALKGLDWPQLLQPHILGELGRPELRGSITHAQRELLVSLGGKRGQVRVLHGLIRETEGTDFSYSVDSDFFCEERTEINNAFELLDAYHHEAGWLFRWFTTPALHERLRPTKLA
jgi:uncharacterized protein (TIGR04255 family)